MVPTSDRRCGRFHDCALIELEKSLFRGVCATPAPHITTSTKHALFEHRRTLRRQQLTQQHIWNVIEPVDELSEKRWRSFSFVLVRSESVRHMVGISHRRSDHVTERVLQAPMELSPPSRPQAVEREHRRTAPQITPKFTAEEPR